ncbi:hypothetical protein [Lacipirellula limnantheis]|nr:hypothetical protein [Lacipirellula limnantheis]
MIQARGGAIAVAQLHAVLDVVELIIESEGFHGCIFVNAAMEVPLPHEPAHVAASQSKQAIEDILYAIAVNVRADEPRSLARELCLIMEGAYVTSMFPAAKTQSTSPAESPIV